MQFCGINSNCDVVVIFFKAALQHLAILLGVIISIISVQFASRVGHLSHRCSVLAEFVLIILCDVVALSVLVLDVSCMVLLGSGL